MKRPRPSGDKRGRSDCAQPVAYALFFSSPASESGETSSNSASTTPSSAGASAAAPSPEPCEAMYAASQGSGDGAAAEAPADDGVVDAEFEEVSPDAEAEAGDEKKSA